VSADTSSIIIHKTKKVIIGRVDGMDASTSKDVVIWWSGNPYVYSYQVQACSIPERVVWIDG